MSVIRLRFDFADSSLDSAALCLFLNFEIPAASSISPRLSEGFDERILTDSSLLDNRVVVTGKTRSCKQILNVAETACLVVE